MNGSGVGMAWGGAEATHKMWKYNKLMQELKFHAHYRKKKSSAPLQTF